jgi:hypothetical protein
MSTYDDPVQGRGGVVFAAAMMIVIGVFQAIEGLVAIFDDDWFVLTRHYTFDLNVTAYGWIHLILGILILAAGCALFAGRVWGGVLAIFLAILAAIANFFFIPYYPFWSITIIALCVWVIWSVTRPGAVTAT